MTDDGKKKRPKKTELLLERWRPLADLAGRTLEVSFNTHAFKARLVDVDKARLIDVVNKPEATLNAEGKLVTPTLIKVEFDSGTLYLVDEKVHAIIVTLSGVRVDMTGMSILFKG